MTTDFDLTKYLINEHDYPPSFPDPNQADEDGLVAIGGQLTVARLITAYEHGIFPWFDHPPVFWFSPNPRLVLYPKNFLTSKSFLNFLKKHTYHVKIDNDFLSTIKSCSSITRKHERDTWITSPFVKAYQRLHQSGIAHSVEVYNQKGDLAGGLYGVSLGKVFFGESMFAKESNTSKLALYYLTIILDDWGFHFVDCQVTTDHLLSLGASEISRFRFLKELKIGLQYPSLIGSWKNSHPLITQKNL